MGMRTPPSHWTAKGLGGITWDSSTLALSCTVRGCSHTVRSRELTGESGQLKKKKRKALSGAREADPQAPVSGMVPERSHIFRIRRTSGPRLRVVTREFHYPGSQRNCFSHLQQLTDDRGDGGGFPHRPQPRPPSVQHLSRQRGQLGYHKMKGKEL